ncbi:MAG: TGS domain-containing protein, partial [Clostridia bacterium]|nr:TGS domain-containing protein [Clostridia bacterium]
MKITFPDGSVREYEQGISAFGVAESIGSRLRKATIACEINGELADAFRPINEDSALKLLTFQDEGGRWAYRHTASHMLAQAVKRLYPEVKLAIGPAIENGFYYDFDAPNAFTPADLEAIEKELVKIEKENLKLERFELPRQ